MRPGSPAAPQVLKELTGAYDPNETPGDAAAARRRERDARRRMAGSRSSAGAARDGAAGWEVGVDVLDLATLEVTSSRP